MLDGNRFHVDKRASFLLAQVGSSWRLVVEPPSFRYVRVYDPLAAANPLRFDRDMYLEAQLEELPEVHVAKTILAEKRAAKES